MTPLRCIAQVALSATTLTAVYTASTFGQNGFLLLRSIVVCNRGGTSATFRLSLARGGEADATKQYLFYDTPIVPNDSFTSALEIGLEPGDVIRAYASNANLTVNLFGA